MQIIVVLVKHHNLAQHARVTDVVAKLMRIRWLTTDMSFLTESVTGVDRCSKEIVGIDLLECCLHTKFNLLT